MISDIIEDVHLQNRQSIKDIDILESLSKLGFDNYLPTIEALSKKLRALELKSDVKKEKCENLLSYQIIKS